MKQQATERFTDRVEDYIKYRPGYPAAVVPYIAGACRLGKQAQIADIGSGTGIFTRRLLEEGFTKVYAVEPNQAMRNAADDTLSAYPAYVPVAAPATATTLADRSVDLITCAQAFHWFNNEATLAEWRRILKPGACAALIWNNRLVHADAFSIAYDHLLKNLGKDYNEVNHQKLDEGDFKRFFHDGRYSYTTFPNEQVFDVEGLAGRARSSSYVPLEGTPAGDKFYRQLQELFRSHQQHGTVTFRYETEIYLGKL